MALEATVPGGAGGWATIGSTGYKYRDPSGVAAGLQKVILKGHNDDKTKLVVQGKGANLPDPDLSSFAAPVQVQLRKSDNPTLCWESTFTAGDVSKNDASQFKAKRIN